MVLEHLGKLHPFEQALVYLLALGPLLLLATVIVISRRHHDDEEDAEE